MSTLLLVGVGILVALIIALLFETSREFIFDIVSQIPDFFSGMFENISEFSFGGLIFGVLTAGFVFMLRNQMLNPFLVHMGHFEAIFWGGATYLGCFVGGYLIGKRLFDE